MMRRYGTIFISTGILITGLLWYERVNKSVRGEDIAECYAAVTERLTMAYATGTDEIEWPSNVVTSVMSWQTVYSHVLGATRKMVLDRTGLSQGGFDIYWLDRESPVPGNGVSIGGTSNEWENSRDVGKNHYYTLPTGVGGKLYQSLYTTSTRTTNEYVTVTDDLPASWYPLVPYFVPGTYPDDSVIETIPWEYGNWWTKTLGVASTNIYLWACEKPTPRSLTVDPTYGQHVFIPVTNAALVSIGIPSVTFDYSTTSNNIQEWEHSIISQVNTVTFHGNKSYFIISDSYSCIDSNIAVVLSSKSLSINEGALGYFTVRPYYAVTTPKTLELVPYGGISLNPTSIVFTSSNWQQDQQVVVTSSDDDVRGNNCAMIRMSGVGNRSWLPIVIFDNDGPPLANPVPSMLQVEKYGGGQVVIELTEAGSNEVFFVDKRVRTNNLDEASAVLNGLQKTIAFCQFDQLSCTAGETYTINLSSNITTSLVDGNYTYRDRNSAFSFLQARMAAASVTTNTSTPSTHGNELYVADFVARAESFEGSYTDESLNTTEEKASQLNVSANALWGYFTGCKVADYPATTAITGGYVHAVSIYAVCHVAPCVNLEWYGETGWEFPNQTDITLWFTDLLQPSFYETRHYGMFSGTVGSYPDLPHVRNDGADYDLPDVEITFKPQRLCWNLLKRVEHPSSPSDCSFSIGSPDKPIIASQADMQKRGGVGSRTTGTLGQPYYRTSASYDWLGSVESRLTVDFFAIVVEWDWKHCADTEYEPEPFTPSWQ